MNSATMNLASTHAAHPEPAGSLYWKSGHDLRLLENGEEFYPRVFEAIRGARSEVLIETFILFEDKVGRELQQVLIDAAQRGLRVELTVDAFGSPDLSPDFVGAVTGAGVVLHIFDPKPKVLGFRTNMWRRLHRKLITIDREIAFVGGINFSFDHLAESGPEAKQDYAVEIKGPVVEDIHLFLESAISGKPMKHTRQARREARRAGLPDEDSCSLLFVTRDNGNHPTDIEQHYRAAIRSAKREVVIANAYFFPGFRMMRELRAAARRGVRVVLILQGQADTPLAKWAPRMLFNYLLKAGVEIHEYCERPLHGKVAVVDSHWATVGSSNLDPLSLSFNLESNVFIVDRRFNNFLRGRLEVLLENHCRQVTAEHYEHTNVRAFLAFLAFHFMRRFPALASWVPHHPPHVETVRNEAGCVSTSRRPCDGADGQRNARVQEVQA
ncbi:cardiolipin synthase ClsB [Uliginosibacterium sp. H3]|uniref:Cardiolipin synthase B n=1 Tax=Uliginosibacterium silvisoli TaxID=3114758 RepID=A0ABU6K7X7_9RHOO|nr:cardiolipin synthase ClsB [Uliginosibacterium sp. H3]